MKNISRPFVVDFNRIAEWDCKVLRLLSHHQIRLKDDRYQLWVLMQSNLGRARERAFDGKSGFGVITRHARGRLDREAARAHNHGSRKPFAGNIKMAALSPHDSGN